MVMNAISTLMFDFADVSKNLTWKQRRLEFWAGKKDGGKESVAHLIFVRKQLPPRVFDLSFLDHVGLVA
jgi:hypothetical protein